jgi:transglutaminase-like putative cysteine protease
VKIFDSDPSTRDRIRLVHETRYLETRNSEVGRGSTHARAEIFLPDYGWTGFDPSIGKRVGPRHIAVGVSHHPRSVMPVTGRVSAPPGAGGPMKVTITTHRLPPGP